MGNHRQTPRVRTPEEHFSEAGRYYRNAKERLREAKVKDGLFVDRKPVREASQSAYLAVLEATRGYLLKRGVPPEKLPEDLAGCGDMLERIVGTSGKLVRDFDLVYEHVCNLGRRIGCRDAEYMKLAFEGPGRLVERLRRCKI